MIKKLLLSITIAIGAIMAPNNSSACIDTTTSIWVNCSYSADFQEILVRVNNMQLYGSPGGEFCTCALDDSYLTLYTSIDYVAFVDDNTVNPIPGFQTWSASTTASTAWDNVQAGNWEGFLSETTTGGLPGGLDIDLIIRASPPLGYTITSLDSTLYSSTLGTDGWDDVQGEVALHHTNIVNFTSGGAPVYALEDQAFFDSVDFIYQTAGMVELPSTFNVYPNPTSDILNIEGLTEKVNIKLYNNSGQFITETTTNESVDVKELESGTYFVLMTSANQGTHYFKFMKE